MDGEQEPLTMSLREAARRLGISDYQLRAEVTASRIAYLRVGGRYRFTEEHLRAALASWEVPARQRPRQGVVVNAWGRRTRSYGKP